MRQIGRGIAVYALVLATCVGCASAPKPPTPAAAPATPVSTGPATIVVGQQPCCPHQTLPEFLGLTGLLKAGGAALTRIRSCLGMIWPGMEPRPPVLPITDPANADSANPAVAAAADIKAQEDAAAQKIKALRYLATIGCGGCYPDVEKALLSGLDDCTEEVRYEAVLALRKTGGRPCQFCREQACCSPAVRKKLQDLGFGINETTPCFQEPSARVRRVARLALERCGGAAPVENLPEEGPGGPTAPPEGPPNPAAAFAPAADRGRQWQPAVPASSPVPCEDCAPAAHFSSGPPGF